MESVVPVFRVTALDEILRFYEALGFEVTYRQERPYVYAAMQRGRVALHFIRGIGSGNCLVIVPDAQTYHKAFADGLRSVYGKVLVSGTPRITRFRTGQTRFTVYDPAGNCLTFINQDEPDIDYDAHDDTLSPLMQALENVKFLRDTYHDDQAAAKFLDKKLKQHASAPPIDRARAFAIRAELAIAMGDIETAQAVRDALNGLELSGDERTQHHDELQVAEQLERWLAEKE